MHNSTTEEKLAKRLNIALKGQQPEDQTAMREKDQKKQKIFTHPISNYGAK